MLSKIVAIRTPKSTIKERAGKVERYFRFWD